jgi:putative transposase
MPQARNHTATLHYGKAKHGGKEPSQLKRLKELEAGNSRLKRMYADPIPTQPALQDVVQESCSASSAL